MRNFVQPGEVLTLTAPTGGVVSGGLYIIGGLAVVAAGDADAGDEFEGQRVGVFRLPKTAGTAWIEGQAVHWSGSAAGVDETTGQQIGVAVTAAASGDTEGLVLLGANTLAGGGLINVRKRFTIAQVNAGATLVPAVPGASVRMVRCTAISVGGAASGVTTVDVLATLATASRKLVAFAQASLTQSAVLKDGGSGAAVLADGASYTPNDANTAITVGKTGDDVATATHIDINFTYALDT
jgi:predicted RecA/RadA family phage recombinase